MLNHRTALIGAGVTPHQLCSQITVHNLHFSMSIKQVSSRKIPFRNLHFSKCIVIMILLNVHHANYITQIAFLKNNLTENEIRIIYRCNLNICIAEFVSFPLVC